MEVRAMNIVLLHPDATPDHLGVLPEMLSENDPRPAKEQFNEHYRHGGGWSPLPNMTMLNYVLHYPGDPPFRPFAMACLRDEIILFYDHAIVAVVRPDGSFEACRMD
jgi:hypothetical protein